ncbi:MAG: ABC transporter permease [Lachnospiraceae bacterium]|nr:ABC transporter permease [Lachnospiraceae bacterium]
MGKYVTKRVGQMIVILFLISIFIFLLISFIPGDPVYAMLGEEVSAETYERVYQELNLDKPVVYRYFVWLGNALRGDFGQSTQFHRPTVELLMERMPVTLYFTFLSFFISIPVGVLLGVLSAVYRGKPIDTVVTLLANITACLPQFWIGILLLYVFAMKWSLLPSFGFTWPWEDFGNSVRTTIMPLFCLAIGGIASIARQTRSSMLEVIRQDYIRTARSKGLKERKIIFIHALKNALIPVITLFGMRLGLLVGGSMFMETVFAIPGMGSLFVKAITSRDIPVVQACVLVTALISCMVNLITDILYAVVDPRIKYE